MEVSRLQVAFEATGQRGVQSAIGQTDKSIRDLASNSERSASRMGSAFSGAGKMIALGFGALAAVGIGKAATGFLMMNANAEQLKVQLDIATGSVERANTVFAELQKLAAATPFEFPELVSASARIESFGISSLDVMDTIGDTAAGTGKSLEQVTNAYLDAGMGQYVRLQELGIDAMVVGDQVELSYIKNGKKITESVDKTNGQLIQSTLDAIWNDKYKGAMKKQSRTFLGQWSTLKDNFNLTMQSMTKGVFEFAKGGLDGANRFFDRFNDKRAMGLGLWQSAMSALHTTLNQTFGRGAGDIIIGTIRGIGSAVHTVTDAIVAVGTGFVDFGRYIAAVLDDGDALNDWLTHLPGPIRGVAQAIGELVAALSQGDVGGFFLELASIPINIGKWVIGSIPDFYNWLKGVIYRAVSGGGQGGVAGAQGALGGGVASAFGGTPAISLGTVAISIGQWILGKIPDLYNWLLRVVHNAVAGGGAGAGGVAGAQGALGGGLAAAFGGPTVTFDQVKIEVLAWGKGKFADLGAWLSKEINAALTGGAQVGQILLDLGRIQLAKIPDVSTIHRQIQTALNSINWGNLGFQTGQLTRVLIAKIGQAIAAVASWAASGDNWKKVAVAMSAAMLAIPAAIGYLGMLLVPKAVEFIGGFLRGLGISLPSITDFLSVLPLVIQLGIGSLVDTLKSKGVDLVTGLITGAKDAWDGFVDWLMTRDDQAASQIGDVTTALVSKGVDLIAGLMNGWQQKSLELQAWASGFGGWVFNTIGDVTVILLAKGINLIQGLMDGWHQKSLELATWAAGLGGWIVGQVGDVSNVLYQTGVNIVAGMANGLRAGAGEITSAVSYLVGLIPDTIKNLLGMQSPSKVMADLFRNVPSGAAMGIMNGIPDMQAAVNRMAAASVPRMSTSGYAPLSPSYANVGSSLRMRSGMREGGGNHYYIDLSNAIVGRGAVAEIQQMVHTGVAQKVPALQAQRSVAGSRR